MTATGIFCPQSRTKNVRTWQNFGLPQYSLHTDLSKDIDAENLVKIASEQSFLEPTEQGDIFVPNLGQIMYAPQKYFGLPQYSLQTDLSKDIDAENLVKIASELSFLEPIQQGDFFVPNLGQKMYDPQKNFGLPQYSLQIDLSKDIDAENLVKITSELSFLDPT